MKDIINYINKIDDWIAQKEYNEELELGAKKLILEAKKFGVDKFINEKVNRLCDFGK